MLDGYKVKNCWITKRQINIKLAIYRNLPAGEKKDVHYEFRQNLVKKRPYLVIELVDLVTREEVFLILTVTTQEKASWTKFGPIKCPCLDSFSYLNLNTKFIISKEFAQIYGFNLTRKRIATHRCLSDDEYLLLWEALEEYWKARKGRKLFLFELGLKKNISQIKSIKV
jgi:hypothetical protein